tara:strand:+ start:151 stop:537 length:387 start_codon:yes stop_codon:yes gene_type:complete
MKKLLGIVVLGLLIASPSYSKIIKLKKCYNGDKFDKVKFDKWYYTIDTDKEIASMVVEYNSKYIKKQNNKMKELGQKRRLKEVRILDFDVIFVDSNFAKLRSKATGNEALVNFDEETVSISNSKIQCK